MSKWFRTAKRDGRRQRALLLALAALLGLSSTLPLAAQGAPPSDRQKSRAPKPRGARALAGEELILVMPNSNADQDDLKESLEAAHGTVVGSIGKGSLKVLLVRAEKGKAMETQKRLSKDSKNFRAVNLNQRIKADYVPSDPRVPQAWHLPKLNLYKAWDVVMSTPPKYGTHLSIAILDSGCSWSGDTGIHSWGADVTGVHKKIAEKLEDEMGGFLGTGLFGSDVEDLEKELEVWGNHAHALSMGVYDNHGHGTWVASAAAGAENGKDSVGVAPGTEIVPIKIADGPMGTQIYTDDLALVAGMIVALERGARIVNISYGGINDADRHEVLHELFKYYFEKRNGLIFVSAGNDGVDLPYKDLPYINTVSALKQVKKASKGASPLQLVDRAATGGGWASNTGACVDFAAPGIDIPVTNPDGTSATVGGTSFSSPIVAGIAALMLRVNPKLTNRQVQDILVRSCTGVGGRNTRFGFGMPDAEKAVRMAKGG